MVHERDQWKNPLGDLVRGYPLARAAGARCTRLIRTRQGRRRGVVGFAPRLAASAMRASAAEADPRGYECAATGARRRGDAVRDRFTTGRRNWPV